MTTDSQRWDPDAYGTHARFVSDLGEPVIAAAVEELCPARLRAGVWSVDYVRLRFAAVA